MRAVTVERYGGPEELVVGEVPVPGIGPGEVRIRVVGAAVNPVDLATRQGLLAGAGLHGPAPTSLGWDVSGIVDEVGGSVVRLSGGQRVVGLSDRLDAPSKAQAEFAVLDESAVAGVPDGLDLVEAAALPLIGLTAEQALDELDLDDGQYVLITGAGGGVGSMAVQLARLRGLRVVTIASRRHRDRLRELGAELFVDTVVDPGGAVGEGSGRVAVGGAPGRVDPGRAVREALGRGVDGVLDVAGLGAGVLDAVRNRGSYVGLVVTARPPGLRGIRSTSLAVQADWRQLTVLAALVAAGSLRLPPVSTLPFGEVRTAHRLLRDGVDHRIVLTPDVVHA